jgi:glucokinase
VAGPTAIGIDLGGTKVAGVVMDGSGRIGRRDERRTPGGDASAVMEAVHATVASLAGSSDAVAVGVGVAGMVDFRAGTVPFAPNLPFREEPVRDPVADRSGLPCVVDNDANVAAWGEFLFGAGRGTRHMLLVTVGTGIGGGLVWDGALYRGAHGFAAEIGHVIVEPGGPRCGCGNEGCWEQVASGRALDRLGREEARRRPEGAIARLAEGEPVRGHHVTAAAREGDLAAVRIVGEVGRRLGQGVAGLVNILDPEVVVIGGGVAEEGEILLEPARRAFVDAVEAPDHRPHVPLVPARLGNDAGAIGAAALALELARSGGGRTG